MGACMCLPRAWLFKVRGLDERFRYYGYEDWDLNKRAHLDGLADVGIADWTRIYHQWHQPATDLSKLPPEERAQRQKCIDEAWDLFRTETSIVRNPAGWGADFEEIAP